MNANIDEAHYPEPAKFERVPSIRCTAIPATDAVDPTPTTAVLLREMLSEAAQTWLWSTVVDEGATVEATYPNGSVYRWQPN